MPDLNVVETKDVLTRRTVSADMKPLVDNIRNIPVNRSVEVVCADADEAIGYSNAARRALENGFPYSEREEKQCHLMVSLTTHGNDAPGDDGKTPRRVVYVHKLPGFKPKGTRKPDADGESAGTEG